MTKNIEIPENGTFFYMRKKIAEEFSLDLEGVNMVLATKELLLRQNLEEEYGIQILGNSKFLGIFKFKRFPNLQRSIKYFKNRCLIWLKDF